MGRDIRVWPDVTVEAGDLVEVQARIERPGAEPTTVWYRLPREHAPSVADSADAFALATVFLAMRVGCDLRVHGRVSPTLLRNLEEFQVAWSRWAPGRYRPVTITADREEEGRACPGTAVLMAFSGGLDSCFTAWRQTRGECGRARRQVRAAVMVHGFDIPLTQPEVFTRAAENSRRLLESIGLALIPVTCNFRQLGGDWEDAHGAALASCLHLLGGGYSAGLVAGSHAYEGLRFPWGSNPLTDPMLSSGTFQLVYDAAGFSRPEKARGVSGWPEAMQRLRVCWEGPQKDRNCGRCLRCVGTALCFAAIGIEPPDVLNVGPLGRAVSGLAYQPIKPASLLRLGELLDLARASDIDAPWMRALERLLRLGRRRERLARVLPPVRVPWQYYRLSKVLRRLAIPVQP